MRHTSDALAQCSRVLALRVFSCSRPWRRAHCRRLSRTPDRVRPARARRPRHHRSGALQVVRDAGRPPLSMLDVRESVTHLFSLGRFDDVSVDASSRRRPAWRCATSSVPIHPVVSKSIRRQLLGARHRRRALRRASSIVRHVAAARPRGPSCRASSPTALRERGYRHPAVAARDVDAGSDRATLVFTIDPGPRTTSARSTIVGSPRSRGGVSRAARRGDWRAVSARAPWPPASTSYVDARRPRVLRGAVTPAVQLHGRRPDAPT